MKPFFSGLFSLTGFFFLVTVHAHEGRPVFVQLNALPSSTQTQQNYELQWKIPPVLSKGLEPLISLATDSCKISARQKAKIQKKETPTLVGRKTYTCTNAQKNLIIKIEYPHSNPALSSLIVYQNLEGLSQDIYSSPEKTMIVIPKEANSYDVARQYTLGGIKHILFGLDHLLFVVCLMVLAVTIPRILITITGFTLAHTVTLVLSTLSWINVPILFVEMLIALSILLLAAEIIKKKKDSTKTSLTWRYPVIAASLLGLLHGFGFASVLNEIGLPQSMKVTALLFFNLGIEIGQFMFIALSLIAAFLVTRLTTIRTQRDKLVYSAIYLVGITASYWLFERLIATMGTLSYWI